MIISKFMMTTEPKKKREMLDILASIRGSTEGARGCLGCRIYEDPQDEMFLAYEEVWQTEEDLYRHISSHVFRNLFAVLDLSIKAPEVQFITVSKVKGMEFIEKVYGLRAARGEANQS